MGCADARRPSLSPGINPTYHGPLRLWLPVLLHHTLCLLKSAGAVSRLFDISRLSEVFLGWYRLLPPSVAFPGLTWDVPEWYFNIAESWLREVGKWGQPLVEGGRYVTSMPIPESQEVTYSSRSAFELIATLVDRELDVPRPCRGCFLSSRSSRSQV